MALLAATTLGDAADTVRAEVKANGLSESAHYRLVVQSYDERDGQMPGRRAKPVGSVQRAVTAAELRNGVKVSLLELRAASANGVAVTDDPMVVAWVEAGQPDLEFDGRQARPGAGSVYGVASRGANHGYIQISLNRKLAA